MSAAVAVPAWLEGSDRPLRVQVSAGLAHSRTFERESAYASVGDIFDKGGVGGLGAAYAVGRHFDVLGEIGYTRLSFDPENPVRYSSRLDSGSLSADRDASLATLDVGARARHWLGRTRAMSVYAVAGGGPVRLSYDLLATQTLVGTAPRVTPIAFRDTGWSLMGGVGADAAVGRRLALGAELRLRHAFVDTQQILGLDVDDAQHWTVRLVASVVLGRLSSSPDR